ncbi:MAG: hypothetical protein QOF01_3561 [Thermomicrobiales bacterium]|jgi:uncharacterized protein (DUF433 family)|nr:hypothetical protein [Thermomicrobiales bacterium]
MAEPIMAFTIDVAAKLTGLSQWQLRRLDVDGIFQPSLAQENRRRPYSRIYTFADLVSLRAIGTLRKRGISRHQIRRAAKLLKALPGATWEGTKFFIVGKHLYLSYEELTVATEPYGQQAMPEILDLTTIRNDMRRRVDRLKERTKGQIGEVVTDRFIQGGEPVFAGTRIRVATIQSLLRAGHSDAEILHEYPRLTAGDIAQARRSLVGSPAQLAS